VSLSLRPASAEDLRRYAGCDLPADWAIDGWAIGYAAERAGEIVALGLVTRDIYLRAWAWFNSRERLPALMMHRKAKAMLAILREVGEPVIYAGCDYSIPGAEKWLQRLGFVPDTDLSTPERSVWRCNLS
jgi:hypothetical protein